LVRRATLILATALAAAPAAHAAPPIMPLSEMRPGMSCSGLSVIRGTEVSSFDVEVLDVIAPVTGLSGARILVRVSGPAVDATGIGPGFSGSPVICGGRTAGAISEGIGEYGNQVVLATPIEEMLRDGPPPAPTGARRDVRLLRAARPLATPLTVSGLSGRTLRLARGAARRAGRPLLAAPAGPAGGFPAAPMVPGAAAAVTLSTGDLAVGAVGTVTYRDGDRIWAFGHPLDGVGRRSLFLTDAYVFGVIENPLGIAEFGAITYKLASAAGHVQGAITRDSIASVAGTLGSGPNALPLRIEARERSGGSVTLESLLADERSLGYGAGLSLLAPLGVSQAFERLMRDYGPTTFSMCTRFRVRQLKRPIGFCNPYFGVDPALSDLEEAASLIDSFDFGPLDVQDARVSLRARDGVTRDVLVAARGPRRVTRGERIRVPLTLQRRGGGRRTLRVPVRVPRSVRPGMQRLVLSGNGGSGSLEDEIFLELFDLIGGGDDSPEPRNVRELAAAVRRLERPLGIEARFRRRPARVVERSDEISFEGRVRFQLRVTAPRRR
jgi:hypothetical protein